MHVSRSYIQQRSRVLYLGHSHMVESLSDSGDVALQCELLQIWCSEAAHTAYQIHY